LDDAIEDEGEEEGNPRTKKRRLRGIVREEFNSIQTPARNSGEADKDDRYWLASVPRFLNLHGMVDGG
jgi:hypothetical protein